MKIREGLITDSVALSNFPRKRDNGPMGGGNGHFLFPSSDSAEQGSRAFNRSARRKYLRKRLENWDGLGTTYIN